MAMPSLIDGVGRLIDLWGVSDSHDDCLTSPEAIAHAIYLDWALVGQELVQATIAHGQQDHT